MSFTKVAPAGIGTSPGNSILIGDSLLHSTGIDIGNNTGAGVTIRQHGDATFTGIITASAFFGDGSGLEGVSSSGIGTALNDDDTNVLNKIYYVNQELSIGSTVTVNHPDTGTASYTHYQDLVVKDDADFIVADGDTFIPDILGITTSTLAASAATGGRIRAGTITNAGANGAVNFPNGLTGTAGTFTGAITAASGTITGNLGVGGVLTYEDVTNVDSVGLITARSGINVTGNATLTGGVINSAGNINCTSGRFQRGSATVQDGDAIAGGININGLDMDASVIMSVFGNDGDFTRISGSKSRNASVGSHTIVQNNDVLLSLKGFGSDGTNFEEAAQIEMQVDGSPGNNVMPGRILFKTTATDGVQERLRIGSAGQLGIGGANYGTDGQVLTSKGASAAIQWATISTGRPIPTRNLRYVINFDYPDYTNANDTNKRKMITPFMDVDSIYSNSGNPFQYMHKTGGLDGGPRYSNTGSVGSNYLKYETGSLLSVQETRACWYKSNSNGGQSLSGDSHSPGVVLWGDTRNSVYGGLGIRNGKPNANTNSNAHYAATTSVNDGNWHHIAFVTDGPGTNIKIYVDGTLEKEENSPNWTSSTQASDIGGHYGYNNTAPPDNMANVVLYDRLLTQTEIQALIDARELYRGTIFTGSN